MAEPHGREMSAGGPAGEDDRSGDAMRLAVRGEPVEGCRDLRHDLRQRRLGGQSVAGQRDGPAVARRPSPTAAKSSRRFICQ